MDDDYRKRDAVTTQMLQASKKKHEQHQTNWEKVNSYLCFMLLKHLLHFFASKIGGQFATE